RHLRHLYGLWRGDPTRAPRGGAVRDVVHRRQAPPGARVSEPAREASRQAPDIRGGSTPNALIPISSAARSLAAESWHWVSLFVVTGAAVLADQVTKLVVASALSLDDGVKVIGPLSIHHVRNSGIAFGLFASRTSAVIVLTAFAVGAMIVFYA